MLRSAFVPVGNANDGRHTPPYVVNGVQAASINLCATGAPLPARRNAKRASCAAPIRLSPAIKGEFTRLDHHSARSVKV